MGFVPFIRKHRLLFSRPFSPGHQHQHPEDHRHQQHTTSHRSRCAARVTSYSTPELPTSGHTTHTERSHHHQDLPYHGEYITKFHEVVVVTSHPTFRRIHQANPSLPRTSPSSTCSPSPPPARGFAPPWLPSRDPAPASGRPRPRRVAGSRRIPTTRTETRNREQHRQERWDGHWGTEGRGVRVLGARGGAGRSRRCVLRGVACGRGVDGAGRCVCLREVLWKGEGEVFLGLGFFVGGGGRGFCVVSLPWKFYVQLFRWCRARQGC